MFNSAFGLAVPIIAIIGILFLLVDHRLEDEYGRLPRWVAIVETLIGAVMLICAICAIVSTFL